MSETTYKLGELAQAAGTSPRTVRYYVQRGLLPPPAFRGKDSAYAREHLLRLRAIRRLQEAYLPLDAIAAELEGKTAEQIERIAASEVREERALQRSTSAPDMEEAETGAAWRRIVLARGLELHVAEDAPPATKALARSILNVVSSVKEGA